MKLFDGGFLVALLFVVGFFIFAVIDPGDHSGFYESKPKEVEPITYHCTSDLKPNDEIDTCTCYQGDDIISCLPYKNQHGDWFIPKAHSTK